MTARVTGEASFEVDLGNRKLQLQLDGVPKGPRQETLVRRWVTALVAHDEVLTSSDDNVSHRAKFWKPKGRK